MHHLHSNLLLLLTSLFTSASSQLLVLNNEATRPLFVAQDQPQLRSQPHQPPPNHHLQQQQPLGLSSPIMASPNTAPPKASMTQHVSLSDVLGRAQQINVFSGMLRTVDSAISRLEDSGKNATVLAPSNSAISSLPRKPWEDPEDYERFGTESAYVGDDGAERARENLSRFVKAHVVMVSPWREGERVKTMQGNEVWYEKREGSDKLVIQPANVEVEQVSDKASNGEVWIIKGVLNYAR